MSPWVRLEDIPDDQVWPPPNGEWRETTPHVGERSEGWDVPFRYHLRKRRTTDGKFERRVEVTLAGSVVFSYWDDDETWTDEQATTRLLGMFAGALARAFGEHE